MKDYKKLKKAFANDPETLKQLQHEEMMDSMKGKSSQDVLFEFLKKGDKGNDGYTPQKGVDYFTSEEIDSIAKYIKTTVQEEIRPIKGKDYFDGTPGIPGKDADEPKIIKSVLQQLPSLEEIASAVKIPPPSEFNTQDLIQKVLKAIPSPYIPTVEDIVKEIKDKKLLELRDIKGARLDMSDQRYHGGGLSAVSHDATLTGDGTPANPLIVVGGGSGVTAVTATLPLSSTGGTTPDISITQSGAGTNGFLSSTDWNTFNNKAQSGDNISIFTNDVPYLTSVPLTATQIAFGSGGNVITSSSDFTYANGLFVQSQNTAGATLTLHNIGDGISTNILRVDLYSAVGNNPDYLTAFYYVVMDGLSVSDGRLTFGTEGTDTINLKFGRVGIGTITTPTAYLHLPAVSTAGSTAPLKLTLGGTLMTAPEAGAVEAINTHIYWTDSTGTRFQLDQQGSGGGETLAATLVLGNTTGGTNIIISANDVIKSPSLTGTSIIVDDGYIALTTDNGVYSTPFITIDPSKVSLNGLGTGGIDMFVGSIQISHSTLIQFNNAPVKFNALTASTVPYLDASKNLVSSTVTPAELGYVSGVTSSIQAQINAISGGAFLPLAGGIMVGDILMTGNKIIGGSTTTSDLILQTTSGVGTTGADMHFLVGNNGAIEAMTILNNADVGVGTITPDIYSVGNGHKFFTISNPTAGKSAYLTLAGSTVGGGEIDFGNQTTRYFVITGDSNSLNLMGDSGGFNLGISILLNGSVGIGMGAPAARLHLTAGSSVATTAPLKFTTGALLASPEAGAVEFLTDAYYATITTGLVRKTFAFLESPIFSTSITGSYLTVSELLGTDGSKNIVSLAVATYPSLTELTYLKGVTSGIQAQINAKGAGTVTAVSVATANGFSGSSSGGATPVLTISATTQAPADNSTKVATTAYVDNAVLGQNFKEAVKYATTVALPTVVYANGSSGVGATLTGFAVGALSIDSNAPTVGQRVLIKNQVSTLENGIYTVTATGSGIAVFVLTRATDFNQTTDIEDGDTMFVLSGTANSTTTWAVNSGVNPVIGTDPITFAQVAGQGSFSAGNGIAITGNSIAINTTVTADLTTIQTLTNKRVQPRVVAVTQSATPTWNTDNGDVFEILAIAQAITSMTTNLTGTPVEGEMIEVMFRDDGTARAIAWGASFANGGLISLPTTTVISTVLRVKLQWQSTAIWGGTSAWVAVAVA